MNAKQYKYTASDIAEASGIPEARVQYAIRSGVLVPESLVSVSVYVAKHILDDKK